MQTVCLLDGLLTIRHGVPSVARVSAEPPVVTVLCATVDDAPPGLERYADRVQFRITDEPGLAEAVTGAKGLFLWDFFSSAVAEVWPQTTDLDWIHVAAAGVDTLMFPELRSSDVVVTNAHGTFDRPIAEFVLGAVLGHAKLVHESHDLQRQHIWKHRESHSVLGRRVLVVGTGGIGREIARLLTAVGLDVFGAGSRARGGDPDFGEVINSADLADHVADVDYLVNAAPLTPVTTDLIDARVLAALPDSAHVINIGRGPTVVEDELLAALESGRIDGATLDVFRTEPLPDNSPLWDAPGMVISAHMCGDVIGWRTALAEQFLANLDRWLAGQELHNIVDKERGYVSGGNR